MTERDTVASVPAGRAISVRLDDDAAAALRWLEAGGMSQSEAIRSALVAEARRRRERSVLAAEVAALAADESDRREKAAISAHLDELTGAW